MLAYKFLGSGTYGVLSGFRWPVGEWVEVEGPLVPTLNGIHGCRVEELSRWVDQELWTIELDGEIVEGYDALVASRGRLVELVETWDETTASEYAEACAAHIQEPAFGEDAGWRLGHPKPAAEVGYYAAYGAGHRAELAGGEYEAGFSEERAWQSRWLAERLALTS